MTELLSLTELHRQPTDEDWRRLQFTTLLYYIHDTNPDNGLVRDRTDEDAPSSIAAIGMAMATVPVLVERGIMTHEYAGKLARRRLQYLMQLPQGPEPDASGYKGFFYHFLDMETGRRVWQCELSTIDSAFLFAGALTAATYFDRDTPEEAEIRQLATELYERADWNWARDGGATLTHGWRPESGFIPYRWRGYDEGLLLYLLGLGSPNPMNWAGYGEHCWGFTACDGPGWLTREIDGVKREFFTTSLAAPPSVPMTGRLPPGLSSPRCPSPRRSSSRRLANSPGWTSA